MAEWSLLTDGFEVAPDVVPTKHSDDLLRAFEQLVATTAGNRDGLRDGAILALAASPQVRNLVVPVLGGSAFAYRATLFDKTPTANWLVAWHQDLVVPVAERRDASGFGPWSNKHGVWFVQPPEHVLQNLLAVRIDLDGSSANNGALRVLPGTHRLGVLPPSRIAELATGIAPIRCAVPVGGALLMRPLLLHASSKAAKPTHRRIIHLEFAADPLPGGLAFAARIGRPDESDRVR